MSSVTLGSGRVVQLLGRLGEVRYVFHRDGSWDCYCTPVGLELEDLPVGGAACNDSTYHSIWALFVDLGLPAYS